MEVEYFFEGTVPPAERMKEFLPQDPAAQELYDLYIAQGKAPLDAATLVLKASLGIGNKK